MPYPHLEDFGWRRVYRGVWFDPQWTTLTGAAQWLYLALITSPHVTASGILVWAPPRLAQLAARTSVADVIEAAAELSAADYLITDADTDEALIRAYVRHAAVLRNRNTATAIRRQYHGCRSARIKGVLVHELNRLAVERPDLPWGQLVEVLADRALDPGDVHTLFDSAGGDPPPRL
jgi:hypothetical protein